MKQDANDHWAKASDEALLRFLSASRPAASIGEGSEMRAADAGSSPCPEPGSYLDLATGKANGEEADRLLAHAVACAACAEELSRTLHSLEGNPSAEEAAAIAELAASGTEWQRRMARELAATRAARRPHFWWPRSNWSGSIWPGSTRNGWWLAAAAIATVLAIGVVLVAMQRRAHTPEHELALAYMQSRTLELRVPDAGYAGLVVGIHTRGALADREPAPLLEARASLARELERAPQNARWLELEARADVLEERYDSATNILDPLVAQGSATPELLADAATAHYQRGLISGSELDRSTALDYLLQADKLAPTDPVILFNEAIVMEDRGQMMNAVEVWSRFITVERDPNWLAEGKRKLAALEQTLNRLKSHQSRIEQMLATPDAMTALAGDTEKVASFDEELSSYDLKELLGSAYPASSDAEAQASKGLEQARGSPCSQSCQAARKLLEAIAHSLEIKHHDYWLRDLLSVDLASLSVPTQNQFEMALRLLGKASHEDLTGDSAQGKAMAKESLRLFHQLGLPSKSDAGAGLVVAARAGEERASVEYLYALQRRTDFQGCRAFAAQIRTRTTFDPEEGRNLRVHYPWTRFPWMEAQALITEQVCDDTPETRREGRTLGLKAIHIAETNHYPILNSRIHLMLSNDALDSGDEETGERLVLATLRQLYAGEPPTIRIATTLTELAETEQDSTLSYRNESSFRESVRWLELAGDFGGAADIRMALARAEIRAGKTKEAEDQLRHARLEGGPSASSGTRRSNFAEEEIFLAGSMLEQESLPESAMFLDQAEKELKNYSDSWVMQKYALERGMLELELGHYEQAAGILESEIQSSEGHGAHASKPVDASAFAPLDHDLYAELAATWLSQGRSPQSVLALWERFRLRSLGQPVAKCGKVALDCEEAALLTGQHSLGNSLLVGQIVLLDRVLLYRVDKDGIQWSQKILRRQLLLDDAQNFERGVSSPFTSMDAASRLGKNLGEALLPRLPEKPAPDAALLLEPDPLLENVSWPVLPTATGPLGLHYALCEARSIVAEHTKQDDHRSNSGILVSARALIIGASVTSEDEPPLPEAMKEAYSVNAFFPASNLLLGKEATAPRVAEYLTSATVLHFAGHALQSPEGTELLLASTSPGETRPWVDGTLLRRHPPRACRLAVLSACSTGARNSAWHRPLQDMVETLASLGVPEVVATRWQIDSEASVPFMNAFYGSMAKGDSVAMALTVARRAQSGQSKYNNPYFWGAYYVTGGVISQSTGEYHASL